MGVWTAAMPRTHLSALVLAICLLNSAQAYSKLENILFAENNDT